MSVPIWLGVAFGATGIAEIPGQADEALIREMHASVDGTEMPDEVPWCSAFAAWCFVQSGLRVPRGVSRRARSWQTAEGLISVGAPYLGAVAVLWRGSRTGSAGHVGFVVGKTSEGLLLLGGNQKNRVCVAPYPHGQLLEYRWPSAFLPGVSV